MAESDQTPPEKFDLKKAIKALNIADPVSWAKSLSVGIRLAILVGLVAAGIFGYGYFKGKKNTPVTVDLDDSTIVLIDKQGVQHQLVIKDKQLSFDGKTVKVKDIEQLKPYGIGLKPKLAAGVTSAGNPGVGIALEVAHFYSANLDLLGLSSFIGAGVSYDLNIERPIRIKNSAIGLGVGRDIADGSNAVLLYYTISF